MLKILFNIKRGPHSDRQCTTTLSYLNNLKQTLAMLIHNHKVVIENMMAKLSIQREVNSSVSHQKQDGDHVIFSLYGESQGLIQIVKKDMNY